MKAIVYTKDNCPYCTQAKNLLTLKEIPYTEVGIGSDITREDFISLFPDQKSVPLILIDEVKVGGYNDLVNYLKK